MADMLRAVAIPLDQALGQSSEEQALVAELCAGSEDAFAYLMTLYRNPIYNLAYHILGNDSDAADVLQNVMVKIVRGIRQFHGESSLKTWVLRIAFHEASNFRRSWFRRRRRETCSLDDASPESASVAETIAGTGETPYEALELSERREQVQRALRSLSEPYRTAVVLREMEGLTYEEVAAVLGVAEGTVKSRLMRGREMLRRKLRGALQTSTINRV